jgi:hypothetical protein
VHSSPPPLPPSEHTVPQYLMAVAMAVVSEKGRGGKNRQREKG